MSENEANEKYMSKQIKEIQQELELPRHTITKIKNGLLVLRTEAKIEKEVLTKTYEFKLSYLINYKNLLTAYNNNANILVIIYHLVKNSNI